MNKYRIENPNNKDVREYKSRTTGQIPHDGVLEGYFMGKDSPEIRPSLNKNENEKYKMLIIIIMREQ